MKYKYNSQWKDLTVKAGDTLPIGTIVDYDGDTVPSGYEEVDNDIKILWTNPSPSSSFETQTITLSSGDYDFYEVFFAYGVLTSQYTNGFKTIKGKGLIGAIIGYGSATTLRRKIDYTDATHLLVASAYNGANIDDNYMIPLYVIGYKTGVFN